MFQNHRQVRFEKLHMNRHVDKNVLQDSLPTVMDNSILAHANVRTGSAFERPNGVERVRPNAVKLRRPFWASKSLL